MTFARTLRSPIAPLLAAMLAASIPVGIVRAEMVQTDSVIRRVDVESRRAEIAAFLARGDVRDRLGVLGVAPDEAAERVASMSDAEVLQVAQEIDDLPAGQASGYSLVVILLLVIILVLII